MLLAKWTDSCVQMHTMTRAKPAVTCSSVTVRPRARAAPSKAGQEWIDGCGVHGEEVEIARKPIDVPVQYQGGSTGKSRLFRLG